MREAASAAAGIVSAGSSRSGATAAAHEAPGMIDEAAFHALYRRTAAPLRAYAARVLADATRADDIVQETYLRILRRPLPSDDPEELRAYLFRVASNLIADHFRRHRRETIAPVPDRAIEDRDASLRIDMQRTFQRLRPRERQLLWLAHVEGADHREIAKALGLGERSIRVLLSRARRKLAALIQRRDRRSKEL